MEDYYLMGYVGEERTLNDMPQDIGGNQYKIASFFIYNNTMISEVTIPANVIWIGQNAFTGRYPNSFPLKSITFENNTGWRFTADDEDSGITVDVTNAMNNAEIFVKSYPTYFWKR